MRPRTLGCTDEYWNNILARVRMQKWIIKIFCIRLCQKDSIGIHLVQERVSKMKPFCEKKTVLAPFTGLGRRKEAKSVASGGQEGGCCRGQSSSRGGSNEATDRPCLHTRLLAMHVIVTCIVSGCATWASAHL